MSFLHTLSTLSLQLEWYHITPRRSKHRTNVEHMCVAVHSRLKRHQNIPHNKHSNKRSRSGGHTQKRVDTEQMAPTMCIDRTPTHHRNTMNQHYQNSTDDTAITHTPHACVLCNLGPTFHLHLFGQHTAHTHKDQHSHAARAQSSMCIMLLLVLLLFLCVCFVVLLLCCALCARVCLPVSVCCCCSPVSTWGALQIQLLSWQTP